MSAAAAGAHELAWGRLLGRAVGNTSFGLGLTLGLFMLGSGVGALLAPRVGVVWASPRRAYVACEVAIALGAAGTAAYCLFATPPSAWFSLGGSLGLAMDVCAAGLVTLIPALAIGATFPLLVACSPGVPVTRLYAAGLAGVVAGTVTAALAVAPSIGLDGTAMLASGANLAVGAVALRVLHRGAMDAVPRHERHTGDRPAIARFAAAGVFGLGAQVVWNRCLVPYAGVSVLTFASIVSVYVLAQAIGFLLYERLPPQRRDAVADAALAGAGPLAILALAATDSLGTVLGDRDAAPVAWVFGVFGVVLAIVGPTSMLLGLSQAGALRSAEGDSPAGRTARAGRIAGFGTMAAAASALSSALLFLPAFGPRWTLAALSVFAGAGLAFSRESRRWALLPLVLGPLVAAWAPGPTWFLGPAFDGVPTLYAEHGVQDTTAVVVVDRPVEPATRRLVANGVSYSGDSVFAQRYMRLLAHLPALVARGESRALVICVGTGTTLDALRAYDYESIDAVDISPSVRSTLRYFEHVNHRAVDDERVELVLDDGARFLRRTARTYDVITLEPPPPRAPGASALYSIEFYRAARDRLRDGGAIAQWLPLHGMSSIEADAILSTFVAVFPEATLHVAERNEAILVGIAGGEEGRSRPSRLARERVRRDLGGIGLEDEDPFADTLLVDAPSLRAIASRRRVLRDAFPLPEYAPLGGAGARSAPLDEIVERFAGASSAVPGSSAAALGGGMAAFVRIQEGNPAPGDRARVEAAMRAWLAHDPSDPYVQHAFGFGPLLEDRLDRLRGVSPDVIEATRARIAAQRNAFAP